MVRSAHGRLPNPAPATVRLLEGVPPYGRDVADRAHDADRRGACSPRCATAFGPLPDMTVAASGFGGGAGEMDDLPNCTQVVHRPARRRWPSVGPGQPALLLETNLDDVTGEQLGLRRRRRPRGRRARRLGQPGHHEEGPARPRPPRLTDATLVEMLRAEIERVTGTMGVRATAVERWPVARELEQVTVDGMTVRMKVTSGRAKPEFDDVALVAAKTGAPLHEVASRAEEAWRDRAAPTRGPEGAPA